MPIWVIFHSDSNPHLNLDPDLKLYLDPYSKSDPKSHPIRSGFTFMDMVHTVCNCCSVKMISWKTVLYTFTVSSISLKAVKENLITHASNNKVCNSRQSSLYTSQIRLSPPAWIYPLETVQQSCRKDLSENTRI